ncbi:MAG: Mrp/NBP35 family ATP-binding protein [Lachnospiraceae bacterium]|jgi:Mrp family chromosome partitioning ATPase|nr:Mrp/NBP35 family ATP-binding protein [Lachnospiraceae bacterium]
MAERECSSTSCTKESCEGCPSKQSPQSFLVEQNKFSNIKHVIGVVSGKGGVGKSMVTASLANMMASQGYSVGILDADITGPSIPKMYGLHGPAPMAEECIQPIYTKNGIRVMSINLLLEDEEAPVIWRGPILANMVKQFWSDVAWGEIDYLFVDMPPGTGDVPLTVFQSIPVEGILVVTSPQDLVRLIVKKALNMAGSMKIPVLGLIENYSYVVCPDCGKEFKIFGESEIDALSEELNIPVLGKMPIDTKLAELADGAFDQAENEYLLPAENRLMFL